MRIRVNHLKVYSTKVEISKVKTKKNKSFANFISDLKSEYRRLISEDTRVRLT